MKATVPPRGGAAFLDGHLDEPHRHRSGQPRRGRHEGAQRGEGEGDKIKGQETTRQGGS